MSENRSTPQRVADQYRNLAGLPEHKGDGPTSDGDAQELTHFTEPDGGYGGKDGIKNTGAINSAEERLSLEDEERRAALEVPQESRARTQGEDPQPPQANPDVDVPEQPKAPAKKTAAKKTAAKKASKK